MKPPRLSLASCSPWELRLLRALYRHEQRQQWLVDVVRTRLSAVPEAIATLGAAAHPDQFDAGEVPGMPDWSYHFHGIGCCFEHRDGTVLDVDFDALGGKTIDPWFYDHYLRTASNLTVDERGLVEPEPCRDAWMFDLEGLRAQGLLEGAHRVRLTDAGRVLAEQLDAEQLDTSPEHTFQFTEGDRERRVAECIRRIVDERNGAALGALALVDWPRALTTIERVLGERPIDGLTSTGLALLRSQKASSFIPLLLTLGERAVGREPPNPHVRVSCATIVMEASRREAIDADTKRRLLGVLSPDAHGCEGVAALLHTLLDEEEGMLRLARGLSHSVPNARIESAAALVLIGTRGAADALRTAGTHEAIEALAAFRGLDPEPNPHPHAEPQGDGIDGNGRPGRVYRWEEIMEALTPSFVRSSVESLARDFGPLLTRWGAS